MSFVQQIAQANKIWKSEYNMFSISINTHKQIYNRI